MPRLDLQQVDPLRRSKVLLRIGIIQAYAEIKRPTANDTKEHAARLDLSIAQFYRLVREWKQHGKAELLAGAGLERGRSRKRSDGIVDEVRSIIADAISSCGLEADLPTIYAAVLKKCSAAGLTPPSDGAIRIDLMEERSAAAAKSNGAPQLIVGRCWFAVPVALSNSTEMPQALLAVRLPERIITAFDITCDPDGPPRASLVVGQVLALPVGLGELPPLALDAGDAQNASEVYMALRGIRIKPHPRSVQRLLARSLGARIGGVRVLFQRNMAGSAARLLLSRQDTALRPAEAEALAVAAIARHNAIRLRYTNTFALS